MNITGIITEYNPFHNGHLHHLNQAKSATGSNGIICIMSGNFVQRGGPAIVDKWKRTEMALENGVDLVIELPTYYAISSAEIFAKGSVSILNSLGVVNSIYFGSESGNIDLLKEIANILVVEPDEYKNLLKNQLNSGVSYAAAREYALTEYCNNKEISKVISSSNNILGIEYIKALIRLNSNIEPKTLKRQGSNYNDKTISSQFASATSIRQLVKSNDDFNLLKDVMPEKSYSIFNSLREANYPFSFEEDMYQYIKYLITTDSVNYSNLSEVVEGLDKKFIKEIQHSKTLNEFILNVKSKRYTYTKISRILTQIYLRLDKENYSDLDLENHHYARVLGFNDKGREILSLIKKNSSIPIISKVPRHFDNPLLQLDISSTRAYSILNSNVPAQGDYLISPIKY